MKHFAFCWNLNAMTNIYEWNQLEKWDRMGERARSRVGEWVEIQAKRLLNCSISLNEFLKFSYRIRILDHCFGPYTYGQSQQMKNLFDSSRFCSSSSISMFIEFIQFLFIKHQTLNIANMKTIVYISCISYI